MTVRLARGGLLHPALIAGMCWWGVACGSDAQGADDGVNDPDSTGPDDSAPDDSGSEPDDTSSDGSSCPETCFVANECVTQCGDQPKPMGCCPCPSGMINALVECRDEPEPIDCGDIGTECDGDEACPEEMTCESGLCAPVTGVCGVPPDGSICPLYESCLLRQRNEGICVPNDAVECMCNDIGRQIFFCTP